MTIGCASIAVGLGLRLTPQVISAMERLDAMRTLQTAPILRERWLTLVLVLVAVLSVMILTLIGVSVNRIQHERSVAAQAFLENVARRHLFIQRLLRQFHYCVAIPFDQGIGNRLQVCHEPSPILAYVTRAGLAVRPMNLR